MKEKHAAVDPARFDQTWPHRLTCSSGKKLSQIQHQASEQFLLEDPCKKGGVQGLLWSSVFQTNSANPALRSAIKKKRRSRLNIRGRQVELLCNAPS
jgi:hypothetical protein